MLLFWLTCVPAAHLFGSPKGVLSPALVLVLIDGVLIFAFVVLAGSFISSLRVFGSLPLSKRRLTLNCVSLPFAALLPVAFASFFASPILLAIYVSSAGCWLVYNLVYMGWNKLAAMVTLNSLLVLLGLWQFGYTAMLAAKQPTALIVLKGMGLAAVGAMAVVSSFLTWQLLRRSNRPYQKKPGLSPPF